MFPWYLQYLLTGFRQTFVTGASRDRDELIAFWDQKVECQGHSMTKCAREFYVSAICPVSIDEFLPNLSLVRLSTEMNWLGFGVKRSKFKVTAWPNASQISVFPLYLQYLLIDFRQIFVTGASWDTDDLITFLGQKVKVQRHTIVAEAHSTRRYRRVQLFLVCLCFSFPYFNSFASY